MITSIVVTGTHTIKMNSNKKIKIGDNVKVGAQSGILNNVKDGSEIIGSPAMLPVREWYKSSVIFGKLPEMYRELSQLKKDISELKK